MTENNEFTHDLIEHSFVQIDADTVEYEFEVPADLYYFRGHFDEKPILPAVFQLNTLVIKRIEKLWPEFNVLTKISSIKFRSAIQPKDKLLLHLHRDAEKRRVKFKIDRGDSNCSLGTLIFEDKE